MSNSFFVGTRKGLFRFDRTATGWKQAVTAFLGAQVPMLLSDARDRRLHAAVEHGHFGTKMHRSEDSGATWEELDPPTYPPKPEDVPDTLDPFRKTVVPWSLEKVWALEAGGADQPGRLWCGTLPGGLFRSDNGGDTWDLNRPLWDRPERAKWMGGGYDVPGIHSICVHPEDSRKVAIGISCGGVWRTEDDGGTWEQGAHGMTYDFLPAEQGGAEPDSQDPHRMVQCRAAPDHFWVQHHCSIYRSTNGARSWNEIKNVKPSAFGFAVAVHHKDPDTAWFVPAIKDEVRYPADARFVLTRTRDGGQSFETLSKGLPAGPAYDIVFRHALDLDASSQCLVVGSTTGSLWISEDQGDSWTALSHHLPPVYCVRFA